MLMKNLARFIQTVFKKKITQEELVQEHSGKDVVWASNSVRFIFNIAWLPTELKQKRLITISKQAKCFY